MGCERFVNMMTEALYGDLDGAEKRELSDHLAHCSSCAAEYEAMRATLDVMNRRNRPDPGEAFWDGYWQRLSDRMQEEGVGASTASPSWWRRHAGSPGRWAYRVAAAAAILTVGVFAGRTFFAPEIPVSTGPQVATEQPAVDKTRDQMPDQVAEIPKAEPTRDEPVVADKGTPPPPTRTQPDTPADTPVKSPSTAPTDAQLASNDRAMRYVEKSQLLLIALVNNDPASDGYAADFGMQQQRSRQLVDEAEGLKQELDDPKQRRLRELVGELEKILMQIANLESEDDMDAVEFIRSRVDDHDVLLKINLEQMRHGADVDGSASGEARGSNSQRSIW